MEQILPKLPFIERAIQYISPRWAADRLIARSFFEEADQMRKYNGAANGPLTKDWFAQSTSARAEITTDIIQLRNRMRELVRNDGWAYTAIQALANNVVGKGIQPTFSGPDKLKEAAEVAFMKWCKSLDCDYYGRMNFFGLQQLSIKGMFQSGDVLIVKRYIGTGRNMQLSLQVLESDLLVHWYSMAEPSGFPAGSYVENGIYFDSNDRVLGYEIYEQHPGDGYYWGNSLKHFFLDAKDCILLLEADRPGQHRGVPRGTAVMLDLKMLSQYELAQAHKQTVSALFAMFIKSSSPSGLPSGTGANKKYPPLQNLTPGTIMYMNMGEEVQPSQPPSIDGFDEYTMNKLRKIAKGYGLSYAVLSGDMKGASFSSERMGWIEMHRNIESLQDHVMITKFCATVAKWWVELERLKGTLPVDTSELRIDWTPPRREMLDPVKETKALIELVQAGFKTIPDAIRSLGDDHNRVFSEIKKTYEQLDLSKLVLSSDYRVIHEEKMKTVKPNGDPGAPPEPAK